MLSLDNFHNFINTLGICRDVLPYVTARALFYCQSLRISARSSGTRKASDQYASYQEKIMNNDNKNLLRLILTSCDVSARIELQSNVRNIHICTAYLRDA